MSRDTLGDVAQRGLRERGQDMPLHRGLAKDFDPDLTGAVGTDLDHSWIIEPGSQWLQRGFKEDGLGRRFARLRGHFVIFPLGGGAAAGGGGM